MSDKGPIDPLEASVRADADEFAERLAGFLDAHPVGDIIVARALGIALGSLVAIQGPERQDLLVRHHRAALTETLHAAERMRARGGL